MKLELTSVRVIDCGPLRDVRIDFTDAQTKAPLPVVLLYGPNGGGKTTVLEVIAALTGRVFMGMSYYPRTILERAAYAQIDCLMDGETVSFVSAQPPDDAVVYRRLIYPDASNTINSASNPEAMGSLHSVWPPAILYFPHARQIVSTSGKEVIREEIQYQPVVRYENMWEHRGSLNSYLVWLEYSDLQTFQHAVGFLSTLYSDGKTFEVDRKHLTALVRLPSGEVHDIALLSSGEQNLLIVMLELYRRISPHSIVLIDELENSLHEAFQHRFGQALLRLQAEIPFQLIATTHSKTFIDIFGEKSVRVLPMLPRNLK